MPGGTGRARTSAGPKARPSAAQEGLPATKFQGPPHSDGCAAQRAPAGRHQAGATLQQTSPPRERGRPRFPGRAAKPLRTARTQAAGGPEL
ncbi:hypothetical protein NDU88_000863 [Pleurodeles waltl]|uniref:Uncharacterized protein n=1 Tax=Pleurodeles waltl TaxID=8319 RepID=A0AAV7S934_PLEWA|nr:hypothetical protein NDU88_000863 [Pleurodeles waltl]